MQLDKHLSIIKFKSFNRYCILRLLHIKFKQAAAKLFNPSLGIHGVGE